MAHLNGGILPSGIEEYAALRPEIYKRIEDIDKNCRELVGKQFIESLRSATCSTFVYLKKYRNRLRSARYRKRYLLPSRCFDDTT